MSRQRHIYRTPYGEIVTPAEVHRVGWAGLINWIVSECLMTARDYPMKPSDIFNCGGGNATVSGSKEAVTIRLDNERGGPIWFTLDGDMAEALARRIMQVRQEG